jgi:hypothetical protein
MPLSSSVLITPVVDTQQCLTPTWLRFLRTRTGAEDHLTPGLLQTPLVERTGLMQATWLAFFSDVGLPVPSGLAQLPVVGRNRWLAPVWERHLREY